MTDFTEFLRAVDEGDIDELERRFVSEYVSMTNEVGETALHIATNKGNIRTVEFLLRKGWKMEDETIAKYRPIHCAAENGFTSIVSTFIDRGCSLNFRTINEDTPYELAIKNKKAECAEIILEAQQHPKQNEISSENGDTSSMEVTSLDDYEKGAKIGGGGFGEVFKYVHRTTGAVIAVKIVPLLSNDSNKSEKKSIENDINSYKERLNHRRIVKYISGIEHESILYIIMEWMEGGSIRDMLDKNEKLTPKRISGYTKQVLEGLAFLHKMLIVHRDVKAANILRDRNDDVKLTDFGVSRQLETLSLASVGDGKKKTDGSNSETNFVNSFCGTVHWMAPEVVKAERYNFSVDVWSLGITIIEMLTCYPPYHMLKPFNAMSRIVETKNVKLPQSVPKEMKSFLEKVLNYEPKERPTIEVLLQSDFIAKFPLD